MIKQMIEEAKHVNLNRYVGVEKALFRMGIASIDDPVYWLAEESYDKDGKAYPEGRDEFAAFLQRSDAEVAFEKRIRGGVTDDIGILMGLTWMGMDENGNLWPNDMDYIKEYREGEIVDLRGFPETFELVKEI